MATSVKIRFNDVDLLIPVPSPNATTLEELALEAYRRAAGRADPPPRLRLSFRGKSLDLKSPYRLAGVVKGCTLVLSVVEDCNSSLPSTPKPRIATPEPAAMAIEPSPTLAVETDPKTIEAAGAALRAELWDEDARDCVLLLAKILWNCAKRPRDAAVRKIQTANPTFASKTKRARSAIQFLKLCGFEETEGALVLRPERETEEALREGLRELERHAHQLGLGLGGPFYSPAARFPEVEDTGVWRAYRAPPASSVSPANTSSTPAFDPFKTMVLGKTVSVHEDTPVERRLKELQAKQAALTAEFARRPVERREVGIPASSDFNPRRFAIQSTEEDEDEDLEDDQVDARGAAALSRHQQAVAEKQKRAENFQTKAMRDLHALEKARVHPLARIRVFLPDRSVFQADFSPQERVRDVLACLLGACVPSSLTIRGLQLVEGPPVKRHDPEATLSESGLVPAAIVRVVKLEGHEGELKLSEAMFDEAKAGVLSEPLPAGVPLVEPARAPAAAEGKKKAGGGKPKWLKL